MLITSSCRQFSFLLFCSGRNKAYFWLVKNKSTWNIWGLLRCNYSFIFHPKKTYLHSWYFQKEEKKQLQEAFVHLLCKYSLLRLKIIDDTHGARRHCGQRRLLELLDLTTQTHTHVHTTVHLHLEAGRKHRDQSSVGKVTEGNRIRCRFIIMLSGDLLLCR